MIKEIQIFIEGGSKGQNRASSQKLRLGFLQFFDELNQTARSKNIKFKAIICGSIDETFRIFRYENTKANNAFLCFLVDSDKPLEDNDTPKNFLEREKKWDLKNIADNQCHLMVQIMESWFLADVETLKSFYGQNFKHNAIPKQPNVEKIAKLDVENSLDKATNETSKGKYHKIQHGAELLGKIETDKVKEKSAHCNRLFETISKNLS
jgi:Domain of unknown function (DUF4276)